MTTCSTAQLDTESPMLLEPRTLHPKGRKVQQPTVTTVGLHLISILMISLINSLAIPRLQPQRHKEKTMWNQSEFCHPRKPWSAECTVTVSEHYIQNTDPNQKWLHCKWTCSGQNSCARKQGHRQIPHPCQV